jgi:hypothetical protein
MVSVQKIGHPNQFFKGIGFGVGEGRNRKYI